MRIRYSNTLEDLVTFNRHYCDHSPTMRWKFTLWTKIAPAVVLPVAALATVTTGYGAYLFAGSCLAAYMFFLMPGLMRWEHERTVRRLYTEGKDSFLSHELELTPVALIERSAVGETLSRLESIERVESEGEYTFIYLTPITAHVVPRHGVTDGDYEAFVAALRQRLADIPREKVS
jgi:hypothetical protein